MVAGDDRKATYGPRPPRQPVIPLQVIMTQANLDRMRWQDKQLCAQVNPEIFFPEKGGSVRGPEAHLRHVRRPGRVPGLRAHARRTGPAGFGIFEGGDVFDLDAHGAAEPSLEGSFMTSSSITRHRAAVLLALLYLPRLRKKPAPAG